MDAGELEALAALIASLRAQLQALPLSNGNKASRLELNHQLEAARTTLDGHERAIKIEALQLTLVQLEEQLRAAAVDPTLRGRHAELRRQKAELQSEIEVLRHAPIG